MSGDGSDIDRYYLNPTIGIRTTGNVLMRRGIVQYIRRKAPLLVGRVLDVGCGFSPYRTLLTGAEEYVGMDLHGAPYDNPYVKVRFDGAEFPVGDATFDSVLSTEVIEHTPDPRLHACEVWRVLKPGGWAVFTVPFVWPVHDGPYDFQRLTPFGVRRLLEQASFQDIEITARGGVATCLTQLAAFYLSQTFAGHRWLARARAVLLAPLLLTMLKLMPLLDRRSAADLPDLTLGYGVCARKTASSPGPLPTRV